MQLANNKTDDTQEFIRHIVAIIANMALYGPEHPQISNLCDKAIDKAQRLFNKTPLYTFKVVDNRLICNDIRQAQTLTTERFNAQLSGKHVQYIEFSAGLDKKELLTLCQALGDPASNRVSINSPHILISQLTLKNDLNKKGHVVTNFSEIAEKNCDKFLETYKSIEKQQQLSVTAIAEIVDDFITACSSQGNIMLALAPLRSMDEYVYVHSTNICLLNLAQAKLLGITGQPLKEIGIAAMLHDVGKMFVPAEILNKPGKPDQQEWEMIKRHPRLGAEYLINCPGIPYLAVINAYEHHIGFDGSGYPASNTKRDLSICSHMTTISDIYDALRTRRSYKDPMTFSRIHQIMNESMGKSLHPQLTRSFLEAMAQVDGDEL